MSGLGRSRHIGINLKPSLNINAFFNGLSYVMTNVMAAAEPRAKYILLTDVVPVDEGRYKFHNRSDTCLLSPVIPQPFHF